MIALVKYNFFKSTPENNERYGRANWYKSNQKRLIEIVANGGTLWVITSLKQTKDTTRIYSLAYRLMNCKPLKLTDPTKDRFGKYGVQSAFKDSEHFGHNNMNEILLSLSFKPCNPIKDKSKIGNSIQTIRELNASDINLLNDYVEKIKFGKQIFISYSSKDRILANTIKEKLESHGHGVWLDHKSIVSGQIWNDALNRGLKNTLVMIVIVSNKASKSNWVQKETIYAIEKYNKLNGFKSIIPICIDEKAWMQFEHLHKFQRLKLRHNHINELLMQLVMDLKNNRA